MKKVIVLIVAVLLAYSGFSQNSSTFNNGSLNIQTQVIDSARTFSINFVNGEQFRKILMLTWGLPNIIEAGNLVWYNHDLANVGINVNIKLSDGIETNDAGAVVFKAFPSEEDKNTMLNSLQSNQKRVFKLIIVSQQNTNVVTTKVAEDAVISAIDNAITSNY